MHVIYVIIDTVVDVTEGIIAVIYVGACVVVDVVVDVVTSARGKITMTAGAYVIVVVEESIVCI